MFNNKWITTGERLVKFRQKLSLQLKLHPFKDITVSIYNKKKTPDINWSIEGSHAHWLLSKAPKNCSSVQWVICEVTFCSFFKPQLTNLNDMYTFSLKAGIFSSYERRCQYYVAHISFHKKKMNFSWEEFSIGINSN